MIKKVFYSSLNNAIYNTKKEAQNAEDKFMEKYFKDMKERGEAKRRKMQMIIDKSSNLNQKYFGVEH